MQLITVSPQGLHLNSHKQLTRHQPIQAFQPKTDLRFPLIDKRFGIIKPIVKEGDKVSKGQLIAQHDELPSLNIFASVSGIIKGIEQCAVLDEKPQPCLVLEPKPDANEQLFQPLDFQKAKQQDLINRIADAGIIGLGGAGFPSALKLPRDKAIEYLIINAAECEPFITSDERLIIERSEAIVQAIALIKHWLNPQSIKIAIEDDKPEAIKALSDNLPKGLADIQILKTQYPSGSERLLIQSITGQRLEQGQIPAALGILCFNISTLYSMKQAISEGKPLLSRIIAVTGDKLQQAGHYEVPIGSNIAELLESAGVDLSSNPTLIHGGSMMGRRFNYADSPVLKTTHCVVYDASEQFNQSEPKPCIRCGKCADVCPEMLLPQQLHWQTQDFDSGRFEHLRLMDCIECGACDYVCPSDIPLAAEFQLAKTEYRKEQKEKQKSELSKQRFEQRNQRVEKRKLALAERRKNRAKVHKQEQQQKTKQLEQAHIKAGATADLAKLKAEAAKAESIYNQAKKALEQAKKMNAPKLDALEEQVEKLKQHAEKARQLLNEAGE